MLAGQKLGPFQVEKEIGSGAMGTVYRGQYLKNGADVAIKVISLGLDTNPNTLARFDREMAILKTLDHPNIVRLYGSGRHHKVPFYVMEFVKGESLDKMLERRGRFNWEEVVTIGQQICAALQHAHEKSVIHRDLKPANLMMMADGTVKLMDFGIAKSLEGTQLTATNSTVGTAAYMSPEQCRGEKNLTPRADLYSLGVMLYELLTGRRPFKAETTLDMFLAHTEGTFERPSRLVLDIPIWLDTLVCHLLEKEADQRPLDANTVAQSLNRVMEKISAQRSAGVDVVSTRVVDRPLTRTKVEAADRETARALRAAATKKKFKAKSRPVIERVWFQAAAIAALLGAIGGIIYLAFQPPDPNKLYLQATKSMKSDDPAVWLLARQGPIKEYLRYYGTRDDDHSQQMRAWADQVDRQQREHALVNRMKFNLTPEGDAEPIAFKAAKNEKDGDLAAALKRWQKLTPYADSTDEDLHAWGLVAKRRVQDLEAADNWENQLIDQVENFRTRPGGDSPEEEPKASAFLAIHFERFGDTANALELWHRIQGDAERPPDRSWDLLAAKKIRELTPKTPQGTEADDARLEWVRTKLKEADDLRATKRAEAQVIYRDILTLYPKTADPELAALVKQAAQRSTDPPAVPKRR